MLFREYFLSDVLPHLHDSNNSAHKLFFIASQNSTFSLIVIVPQIQQIPPNSHDALRVQQPCLYLLETAFLDVICLGEFSLSLSCTLTLLWLNITDCLTWLGLLRARIAWWSTPIWTEWKERRKLIHHTATQPQNKTVRLWNGLVKDVFLLWRTS